ncbi:hypothetical protein ACG98H_04995 [Corynebacterium sp. L4756]|uniref:hypothetical protein n=1 Tax=unclassified Corynebacterium TaxID=2624378 RepID=UPI00374D221A
MLKKIAPIALSGALALGVAAPAPAFAQNETQAAPGNDFSESVQTSSQGFLEDPAGQTAEIGLLSTYATFMASSIPLSLLGFEQCTLFDTTGC